MEFFTGTEMEIINENLDVHSVPCHHGTSEKAVAKGGWKKEKEKENTLNHAHPADDGMPILSNFFRREY